MTTEESFPPKTSEESVVVASASTRQRKKRKWDQPAEVLISAGLAVPGVLPLNNMGTVVGITLPGVTPFSSSLTNAIPATCTTMAQVFQAPFVQQNTASVVQKLIPKIQDELIAREIVINDAEPTVRYKLTKRQTQEEIQRSTGAVVITRGKYRPPNVLTDAEKPLYLHISAGAHLNDTAERVIAVDRAAAMIEEMLKQGVNSHAHSNMTTGGQIAQPLDACVFLGFDTDPSSNIAARIRGPNDQYINHIMNETGATVKLRGRGSGNFEAQQGEESQQPLHLFLSSNNPKSLEAAKLLAENLLDTISVECGVSRGSSSKGYNAVPPPQQLLVGVQSSGSEQKDTGTSTVGVPSSTVGSTSLAQVSPVILPGVYPQAVASQGGLLCHGQPPTNLVSYPQPSISNGTSYSGYGGIYPQATPLQQVALALRQTPSPASSGSSPATSAEITWSKPNLNPVNEAERRPAHRRKFQEQPVAAKGSSKPFQNSLQGSEFLKPGIPSEESAVRNVSTMPPPRKLVATTSNGMPPPPSRTMPPPPSRTMPPPPPPKFTAVKPLSEANVENTKTKTIPEAVPDTLIKLMEYGDDDDEDSEDTTTTTSEQSKSSPKPQMTGPKPFWAL